MKFLTILLTTLLMLNSSMSIAAGNKNLLVMGEDYDRDTVPRSNQIFQRVQNQLAQELHIAGFDVYDETAITLENFAQGRSRRTDAELIDIAKTISRPPIDLALFFKIYLNGKKTDYNHTMNARIEGRLLNVQTGQRFGNVEYDYPNNMPIPVKCNFDCMLKAAGDHSTVLAADVGNHLAITLANLVDGGDGTGTAGTGNAMPNAYTIIFDQFSQDEISDIDEFLAIFSGYQSHRPSYASSKRTEYWYESTIHSAKLNKNIKRMLDELNIPGTVQFSGNTYTVRKIALRNSRRARYRDEW